ncbi:MAG: methylmalonyl-CoA mutase, partial [Anaerolineaceae bacterium]|nr:methylmalonyl-CoA mutase [Anaerolineaceae bacterium]
RTQQIIAYESGVADTIDPLGGSYVIEALTDEICERARAYIKRIDEMGGALAGIENGYISGEIQDAAYQYQKAVEKKEQIVVGVNNFQVEEKMELERLKVDPAIEVNARARLAALRANRDAAKVNELMAHLETAAKGTENLMPILIHCVENDITLGEICGVLRKTWGEYIAPSWS